uniref:PR domain zinc finger protein 15-like n=1 Tax=Styela clava TaxID=7725 RepID=UPI00193959B6|nr:PR domain zinc finger protein 15-like [Styela clava]
MNSFRAFKLKLPKKTDEETTKNWNSESSGQVTITSDTKYFHAGEDRYKNFASPNVSIPDFSSYGGPPYYSKHAVDEDLCFMQRNTSSEKSDVSQPGFSMIQRRFAAPLFTSMFSSQNPVSCPTFGMYNPLPEVMNRSTETTTAASVTPKHATPTVTLFGGCASPPLNDSDTSSKCSSSPGSIDSGYQAGSLDLLEESMNVSDTDVKQEVEKREGSFECSFCKRTFSYLCHLKVHERVHTGEKPYLCKFCPQQFSQLGSLTVHMRIHTGAKPYQCRECSKNFRHVNSLRRHQRQVHNMTATQLAPVLDKRVKLEQMQEQYRVNDRSVEDSESKRKRTAVDARALYHQQIFQPYNHGYFAQRNIFPGIAPGMLWPQKSVIAPSQGIVSNLDRCEYNNKVIQDLEDTRRCKKFGQDVKSGIQNAAEALLSLSDSTTPSPRKNLAPKTWRPFMTEEDEEKPLKIERGEISHTDNRNGTGHGQHRNMKSIPTFPPPYSGNASKNERITHLKQEMTKLPRLIPISVVRSERAFLKPQGSYFPVYKSQEEQHISPYISPYLGPPPPSLRGEQQQPNERSDKKESNLQVAAGENLARYWNFNEHSSKEDDSSDEGFLSSCSTGEGKTPSSKSEGLEVIAEHEGKSISREVSV